ncbi:hypothetical protein RJ640_008173 [Escallonia rubra]|uniref:C2H2-type domain-containing protein n=1 Tax=Escallonia rubra TaxID=112253 RepID=A0AA88S5H8_9ASTE|nr:hypothetical protein RJ640_008173 [Escallonia rubra]
MRFRKISAGGFHVCGILEGVNSKAFCWGRSLNLEEEISVSHSGEVNVDLAPDAALLSVVGGRLHACGIKSYDRRVVCWGYHAEKSTMPPNGIKLYEVAAGDYFTCGSRSKTARPKSQFVASAREELQLLSQLAGASPVPVAAPIAAHRRTSQSLALLQPPTPQSPHHSKRVLRHCCKKLEKYYSDATVLLRQNGFSWDDKREMVAADDDVWDACIKAHPHLRSYRSKSLPNYEDLGLIFGDGINEGIYTDSFQYRVLGDDLAGVKSGSERSRTFWTPPMDHYLIDLLLDHLHRGNRIGQTFISQAWTDMVTSFNAMFKSYCDKDVLKNRYKHLRRHYNDIRILLEQDGLSWDEARLKAHPDGRSYRVKTVPRYQKLFVVYGQDSYEARYSCLARNAGSECKIPATKQNVAKMFSAPQVSPPGLREDGSYVRQRISSWGGGGSFSGSPLQSIHVMRPLSSNGTLLRCEACDEGYFHPRDLEKHYKEAHSRLDLAYGCKFDMDKVKEESEKHKNDERAMGLKDDVGHTFRFLDDIRHEMAGDKDVRKLWRPLKSNARKQWIVKSMISMKGFLLSRRGEVP